ALFAHDTFGQARWQASGVQTVDQVGGAEHERELGGEPAEGGGRHAVVALERGTDRADDAAEQLLQVAHQRVGAGLWATVAALEGGDAAAVGAFAEESAEERAA